MTSTKLAPRKKVAFFKDGDLNFSGVNLTVTKSKYQSIDALYTDLNDRIELPFGVRAIYTPTGGTEIKNLNELEDGKHYVCSSNRKMKKLDYKQSGLKKPFSTPKIAPANNNHNNINNNKIFTQRRRTKILKFIAKENTDNRSIFVLSPKVKDFQEVLKDASQTLRLQEGPVTALLTLDGKQVTTLQQLYNGADAFFAVGKNTELRRSARSLPLELQKSRPIEEVLNSPGESKSESNAKLPRRNMTKKPVVSKPAGTSRSEKNKALFSLWLVTIETSDLDDASSDHTAFLTLYGDKGKTSEYHLGIPGSNGYFRDTVNEAEMKLENIGKIYKIRIGHDDNGQSIGWHLARILLTNLRNNEEYIFECHEWLSRQRGDGTIVKEFAAIKHGSPMFPNLKYLIKLYTGGISGCGTDANVYINIIGERGDTGMRLLHSNLLNTVPFQVGKTDDFYVNAISLGKLKQVVVTHDNTGDSPDWLLEKIMIIEAKSRVIYTFTCGKWLSEEASTKHVLELAFASELLGKEKIEDYIEEEQDDDDDDMHDNNAENDENMQKDNEVMYEMNNDSNDNDGDTDSENMEDEAKENRYGEDDFEDDDEDDGDDDYEQLYNAESGHDQISQYDKRTDDENEIDDEDEDDDDVNDEYSEDENEDEESPRKYPANSKKNKKKNKSRASTHDNNNNLVNGNVEESKTGRDTKPDDEEGSARSSSGDANESWQLDEENEITLYSKQFGKAICYNNPDTKLHFNGTGKRCCTWTILNGKDVNTKLLYSANSNGYLAVNDGKVMLTKGNPGLLNEFYVKMQGKNEVTIESVVYGRVFLSCFQEGKITAWNEMSEHSIMRIHAKGCLRDNTHVNITSMADGYALKDDGLLMFSEDSSIESCSYIIRKIGPELRAFKNSSSEKFLSVTVTKKVKSVEKKVRDISVWFKVHRAPQNSYVQFESFQNPGQFLARNLKDDTLKVVSNKSFDTTKFNIKIIKAGTKSRLKSGSPDCSPESTAEREELNDEVALNLSTDPNNNNYEENKNKNSEKLKDDANGNTNENEERNVEEDDSDNEDNEDDENGEDTDDEDHENDSTDEDNENENDKNVPSKNEIPVTPPDNEFIYQKVFGEKDLRLGSNKFTPLPPISQRPGTARSSALGRRSQLASASSRSSYSSNGDSSIASYSSDDSNDPDATGSSNDSSSNSSEEEHFNEKPTKIKKKARRPKSNGKKSSESESESGQKKKKDKSKSISIDENNDVNYDQNDEDDNDKRKDKEKKKNLKRKSKEEGENEADNDQVKGDDSDSETQKETEIKNKKNKKDKNKKMKKNGTSDDEKTKDERPNTGKNEPESDNDSDDGNSEEEEKRRKKKKKRKEHGRHKKDKKKHEQNRKQKKDKESDDNFENETDDSDKDKQRDEERNQKKKSIEKNHEKEPNSKEKSNNDRELNITEENPNEEKHSKIEEKSTDDRNDNEPNDLTEKNDLIGNKNQDPEIRNSNETENPTENDQKIEEESNEKHNPANEAEIRNSDSNDSDKNRKGESNSNNKDDNNNEEQK